MTIIQNHTEQIFEIALHLTVKGECPAVRIKLYELPLVFGTGVECGVLVSLEGRDIADEESSYYATEEAIEFFGLDYDRAEYYNCTSFKDVFGALIQASPLFRSAT